MEMTSHPRCLPGQGQICTSTRSLTKTGTENGELLAPLPYGTFFSILYLGHEARCKYCTPFLGGSVWHVFFIFHPSNPSLFLLETVTDLPTAADILPAPSTSRDINHESCQEPTFVSKQPTSIGIPQFLYSDGR